MGNGLCKKWICSSNCILLKLNNVCSYVKRRWVSLNEQWSSGYGAGFPNQESQIQNRWVAPRLTQSFIFLRLTKWVPGIPEYRVVKSKLSPCSGASSIKRGCKVIFRSKSFKLNVTDWPCHVWLQKKLGTLGVCYWLLYTNLGDGILCTLSPNYNIHGENSVYHWWSMCTLKSKSVSEMYLLVVWRSKFTDLANSKKAQSLGKNGCRKKYLDKSLHIVAIATNCSNFLYQCFINHQQSDSVLYITSLPVIISNLPINHYQSLHW